MSHPEYKRQQVIVTALARPTRRLRRVTSRSHHAQGRVNSVSWTDWVHWAGRGLHTLFRMFYNLYFKMFSANATFWNGFYMLLNFWLKWYVTVFCYVICQWHQIYSIKVAVLFSNGIAHIVFFPVQSIIISSRWLSITLFDPHSWLALCIKPVTSGDLYLGNAIHSFSNAQWQLL